MGTSIRLKKSAVSTNAPGTGDIDYGELAINYNDGKLYYKTSSDTIDFFGASSIGGGGYWTKNGSDVYYNSGNVGIGVTSPGEALEVDGNVEITGEFIGDLRGPVTFKAQASEDLTLGDVVYISGISGQTPTVGKADADDAAKMPAFGLVQATTTSGNPCTVVTFGTFVGYDTVNTNNSPTWSVGDTLFVDTTAGGLTNVAPSGESALIQNIGKVQRVDASDGRIKVGGAGRTNATPNLNEGRLFVGNANNQAVADDTVHIDIANTRVGINDTTPTFTLDVNGTFRTTGNTTLGDAGADTVTINATTVDIPNVAAGTDNTVLVYNGSTILTDEIDSRVWGSTLIDGSGTANTIAKFSDSDTITDSLITDDGTTVSITTNTTSDALLITSTEDSSTAAPVITLKRNSGSPADGDYLGQIKFKGENDADQEVVYAKITGKISDASDTTEDGLIEFMLQGGGSNVIGARLTSTDLKLINGVGLEVAGNTTLGDASGDSVTINAQTIALANVAAGTDNTVLVYNGSSIVTDEIDSRVWGSTLVDGSGTANTITKWSDSNTLTDSSITDDGSTVTIGANLTVNGTTTTLNATNSVVTDNIFELNSGVTSNANDSGLIIERGSTGNNALFIWDESEDKFAIGTTTATADSTGNISYTAAGLLVGTLETSGNVTLGDAGADTVTINATTVDIPNVAAGTDNTVLVYNGSTIVTDEIDSRVWGSSLVDGSGTANTIAKFSDSDTLTDSSLTDDGSTVATTAILSGGIFTEKHATSHTLTASELYGAVYYVTGAGTLTLPAAAAGMHFSVITIGAIAVSVDPNGSDLIYLDGTALDDGDKITNTSTAGDIAVFTYYDTTGWYAATNGWTDGGA